MPLFKINSGLFSWLASFFNPKDTRTSMMRLGFWQTLTVASIMILAEVFIYIYLAWAYIDNPLKVTAPDVVVFCSIFVAYNATIGGLVGAAFGGKLWQKNQEINAPKEQEKNPQSNV